MREEDLRNTVGIRVGLENCSNDITVDYPVDILFLPVELVSEMAGGAMWVLVEDAMSQRGSGLT